jgi:hypothetical protein
MSSYLSAQHAERSQIERRNRGLDLMLLKINEDRLQLSVRLAEFNLYRHALARRKSISAARSSGRLNKANMHRRIAGR